MDWVLWLGLHPMFLKQKREWLQTKTETALFGRKTNEKRENVEENCSVICLPRCFLQDPQKNSPFYVRRWSACVVVAPTEASEHYLFEPG